MQVRGIDPRSATWEVSRPIYRVNFFQRNGGGSWASDEYEVAEADDVDQVLRWAKEDGRIFIAYAEVDGGNAAGHLGGPGLIQLYGTDPNSFT